MCRCEKHQTIFSSKLFVPYVNQYKIVFCGQIPLQKASDVKRLSLELVKPNNADFNLFYFAASLIKNYDALNFGTANTCFNNKHSCFSKMPVGT